MKSQTLPDKMATLFSIWESYAQLIRWKNDKHTEQKIQQQRFVLDKFLTHFINISLEERVDICIGEMRNIGNELSQEFMRNVDEVTRDLSEEDATHSLEDYMLRGRGWRLLYAVDRVGLKGVTQRHDLCEVLLNLLPFCSHMKPSCPLDQANNLANEEPIDYARNQQFCQSLDETYNIKLPLSSCFQLMNKSSKLKQLGCPSVQTMKLRRVESSVYQMNGIKHDRKYHDKNKEAKTKKRMTRSTPSKRPLPTSKSDTENEDVTDLSETSRLEERRLKQPRYKRGMRGHLWSPYVKDEDSETDDEYIGSLGQVEDSHISVTAFHLIRIILRLLLSLGELDLSPNVRGRALSATILPHFLHFISRFRHQVPTVDALYGISKAEEWLASQKEEHMKGSLPESQKDTSHDNDDFDSTDKPSASLSPEAKEMKSERNTSLSDEEVEIFPWHGAQKVALLKQAVRAVLTLSGIVATQQNGVKILINLKTYDTLLDCKILDWLIPSSPNFSRSTITSMSGQSVTSKMSIEAGVATDMICGLMQLTQAIYTNLPFNPSSINDANYLTSKLSNSDISSRIKRLMDFIELQTHEIDKTPPASDVFETEFLSSGNSSKPSGLGGVVNTEISVTLCENHFESEPVLQKPSYCGPDGSPVDSPDFEHKSQGNAVSSSFLNGSSENLSKADSKETSSGQEKTSATDRLSSTQISDVSSAHIFDASADPIRCIGALITTLKGIKVNYIHSVKCLKSRHRKCEYGSYYDHHHDILGAPYYTCVQTSHYDNTDADFENSVNISHTMHSSNKKQSETPHWCVVAEMSNILLEYLSEAKFKSSHVQVLSMLRSVGVCCCLQPEKIISAIVPQLPHFSPAVRSYALDTLTSVLLDQFLGAHEHQEGTKTSGFTNTTLKDGINEDRSVFSQDLCRCVHCYLEGSSPLLAGLPTTLDSGFSSSNLEEMRRQRLLERWKSLRTLRKLIIAEDESLAMTCAKHLMTLAIRGNIEIKEELFFGIYLHVLHMRVRIPGLNPDKTNYTTQGPSDQIDPSALEADGEYPNVINSDNPSVPLSISDTRSVLGSVSMINSQESLIDSLMVSGSLTPAEISSAEDTSFDGAVPGAIMLLCVSALPYVLQVDKVMSIFLARGGLTKLTNLLEYEQLRAPVMSVFEALVMIDERRLRGNTSDHKTVYEGGSVIQTFIDTLAKRTCTVTTTLQLMSLQNAKDRKARDSPPLLDENNDFLKFYNDNLLASPKSQNSRESALDDSMYFTPVNEDVEREEEQISSHITTNETLPVLLDMWKTCAKLCMNSRMFRACYRESPCKHVVQETLILALSLLGELSDNGRCPLGHTETYNAQPINPCLKENSCKSNTHAMSGDKRFSRQDTFLANQGANVTGDVEPNPRVLFSHQAKLEFIEAVMMVCFSCHTIAPSQKRGSEDDLWLRLNSALQSCIHLEPCKLSAVFQMLLNVALPRCPSILEYSYSQIVLMLNLKEREDIADEDEVRQLLKLGLDEDGESIFTEHGYEGDTESSICFDWKKGLEYSLQNQLGTCNYSCPCFPAVFRLFVELMVACHRVASRGVILHTVALRLLQTLRSSRRAVRAVCSENLLEVLVTGFKEVLIHCPENGKQSTLQEIILSLVQVIAQSEISSSELRQYLRLFQDNTETTNSLLSTLLSVIEESPVMPTSVAIFPVKRQAAIQEENATSNSDNSDSVGEQEVWKHTAIELDVSGIPWPPCQTGFTIALWMCVDQFVCVNQTGSKKSGQDRRDKTYPVNGKRPFPNPRLQLSECLLVVAIGNKDKMFEVWVHPRTASLICRLTTGTAEVTVLKYVSFDHLLTPGRWQLLVVSYIDILDGSTFVGKLNLLVDGWLKKDVILDHPASITRQQKFTRPSLCLGDARHSAAKIHTGTWRLGTLRLFRDTSLSGDFWFHLYCVGPNCEGIGKCDCGELQACYTPAMLKHMVDVAHLNWDVMVGAAQLPDIDTARACELLVYRVCHSGVYAKMVLPLTPPSLNSDDLGLVPPSGSQSDLLSQKPVVVKANLRGKVKVRYMNTLEKAMEQAGGVEAVLFLVAKIFEDSMKAVDKGGSLEVAEHLQSKVTHILFQLIHRFPALAQSFHEANGYIMLTKVLTSSKSIVGFHLLKVLLDACATETLFKTSPSSPQPVLRSNPEAVIRDIDILTQLLLHWRIWHRGGDQVTVTLFAALEALVSPNHPHRKFNIKQMLAGGVINKIFSIYLERIQDSQQSLSVSVSQSASVVITSLLGSPPDLHLLMPVMDFLLLVHPAPSGFINFNPNYFYFKLWWDGERPRSFSSDQKKMKTKSTRTISEKSDATVEQSREVTTGPKLVSVHDSTKFDPTLSIRSQEADNLDNSQDENEEFKFPPLKPANPNSEQTLDMDADYEESDTSWRLKKKATSSRVTDTATSISSVQNLDNSDLSSSSHDSLDDADLKDLKTRSALEQKDLKSSLSASQASGKRKKKSSPRRKLVYPSSDKESSVGDSVEMGIELNVDQNEINSLWKHKRGNSGKERVPVNNHVLLSDSSHFEEEVDQGLMKLCISLIEYLTDIINGYPEPSLDNVFSKVVSPKSMLVLAKNPSSGMRLAVMKLLGTYLSKAPPSLIDAFMKMDGFYLLANQLRSFPVTIHHMESAMSMLLKQDFVFDGNFMVGDLGELSTIQQVAPVLFLSLLESTVSDPKLCRNSLALLSQLLESTPTMSTLLLDLGLAETMCNLANSIQRRYISEPSQEEDELTRVLLVDVQHVLCSAVVSEFSWMGPTHFQNVEDMFTLLKALEDHESESSIKRADTARAFQISLVVKILEYVDKRSEELNSVSQSWFTSSTASNASLSSSKSLRPRQTPSSKSFSASTMTTTSPAPHSHLKSTVTSQPIKTVTNLTRRSTFSSPDMMGFLSDAALEDRLANQFDSDSSSSSRIGTPPRGVGNGHKHSRIGSLFSRKRKIIYASIDQSDLLDRFRKILVTATDLAIMFPREEQIRPNKERPLNLFTEPNTPCLDDRYLKHLFVTIFRFYQHNLVKDVYNKKLKNPIMNGAKDVLKAQFTRLFLCLMSTKVDFDMRAYTLAFIITEPLGTDALRAVIAEKQVGVELSFYLYNLLAIWKDWLNPAQRENGFSLMQILRSAGYTVNSPDQVLTQAQVNSLMEDKKVIEARYFKDYTMWVQKRQMGTVRISQKFEPVCRRITEQAMTVNQDVNRLQIEERKKLIIHIKGAMTTQIQLKKQWQELVQMLTHERGVWYQQASYPQSWQLDPTEGPGRVRKRLQRCHLGINKKFLKPEHQWKLEAESKDPPLLFLFEDDHQMSDSAALIYRLYTNEKIQHTCRCTAVSPASESKGELLVGEMCIFFVADGAITGANYTQLLLGNLDQLSITWPHTDIRELHKRWYQLQDVGLEIFLISGRTCLLAFQSMRERDELYTILRNTLELPNLVAAETLQTIQQSWLAGEVTNYDYLMHLNKLSGRSYTDLMQYPVFPFILRDYQSNQLNLESSHVYRNLKKPIAIQDKSKEQRYKDNFEFLCQEASRPDSENEMMRVAPFHYGSHYSNSGTVLHYMVRMPPFTRMFLTYQDSSFDIPDRTFHSMGTSWRLSSFESSTDVKELIPEFFFFPEFLINIEGFDFGQRQNGESVNDVNLPPWCQGDPRLFVFIHRQALESAHVTSHLNHWLDLVFGYKQQGEEAVKAINVFHPSTYFGVDASGIRDQLKRQALITMIKTYGQTPKQLFRTPHKAVQPQATTPQPVGMDYRQVYVPSPVPSVKGLKWGNYLGSLDLGPPMSRDLVNVAPKVITKLVALPFGPVFGVERNANILLLHGKKRDMAVKTADVMWAGVVTWDYHDNIIRIRSSNDKPLINFMPHKSFGKVTCVESVPDCRLLFTAGSAGVINVFSMTHNSSKPSSLQLRGAKKTLYGHSAPITCLFVSQAFSVLVSGSMDGTCIIWDLNRLNYVRSINSHSAEIAALTVSDTLGDIATVSWTSKESCRLQLHTINAAHVATQEVSDIIHCLAYSSAPEGRSVNVVAGGMETGSIRLWSSWDLSPLRDLTKDSSNLAPIISLTFSVDSQYLLASAADGVVTLWDKDVKSLREHAEKFIPVIMEGEK